MPNFSDITSINLGNTFGGWYNKTNEIITRLNSLDVASVTGGDGILISPQSTTTGGFTVEFSGNITKNTTFSGDVQIVGTLTYGSLNANTTTTNLTIPYATGVTVGNVVYIDSTGLAQKAKADDECTSEVIGIVTSITGGNATIATTGKVSGASLAQLFTGITGATFIKGAVYFLSAGISGCGVTSEPNIVTYVSKPVLVGITGDSALILPHRGFIANNGISGISFNNTVGITNAVLSLNGVSAALNSIVGFTANPLGPWYPPIQILQKRTTGNLHAVTALSNLTGELSYNVVSSISNLPNLQYTDKFGTIRDAGTNTISGSTETLSRRIKTGSALFNIFSTFGGLTADLSDVYKLHRIRIIPIKLPDYVSVIPFTLYRMYHRYGCTNYIQKYGLSSPFNSARAAGEHHIQMNMKNCFITFSSLGLSQTVTPASEFYSPIFKKAYYGHTGTTGDGATAAIFTGIALAMGTLDSSGPYAAIYGPNSVTSGGTDIIDWEKSKNIINRPYGWSFNSVIMNDQYTSEYIKSSIEGSEENFASPAGYTLDSSILGWNAQYGATPESIAIYFPNIDAVIQNSSLTSGVKIELQIILELYSYNPISGVSGSIMPVPIHCVIDTAKVTLFGTRVNNNAVP